VNSIIVYLIVPEDNTHPSQATMSLGSIEAYPKEEKAISLSKIMRSPSDDRDESKAKKIVLPYRLEGPIVDGSKKPVVIEKDGQVSLI
jgi:hypothetical protein